MAKTKKTAVAKRSGTATSRDPLKKASRKRSSKRAVSKKITLETISPDKQFVLCDGRSLNHYMALADSLESMDLQTFNHHVTTSKNDFAAWIEDVFNEHELAAEVRQAKDADQMRLIIYKHILDVYVKK